MREIFGALQGELNGGRDAVLVTVTEHHGSAPRGAGAMMLAGAAGRLAGTVGGGSVEHEALRLAADLLRRKNSSLHTFELGGGEGSLDMVCGGGVTLWLQYIAPETAWAGLADEVLERLAEKRPACLVLHLDGRPAVLEENGARRCVCFGDRCLVPLPVGERAVIFGGGHCAAALAPVLASVGFRVTVYDEREEFVTADRFPGAENLICGGYGDIAAGVALTPEDYVVVMTNGHRHDLEVEAQVLPHKTAYLGVMGSKKKTAAINEELLRRGFSEEDLRRIHAPIGLAIKSATPEEIAVSIAGEMILVRGENREKSGEAQGRACPA